MSLLSLPLEIILYIAEYIDEPADLLTLISLNWSTYNLFISDLYKRDVANADGWALGWYANRGVAKGVRGMLAAGAKINSTNGDGTPLSLAVEGSHTHIVKLLLENGASPDIPADFPPLEAAIYESQRDDDFEIPQMLLDYGANINFSFEGEWGFQESALHIAARNYNCNLLKFLLDRGANVQFGVRPDEDAVSLLHYVVYPLEYNNQVDRPQLENVVRLLVDAGVDVNCADKDYKTPLMVAASYGSADAVQVFLNCGADANVRMSGNNYDGWLPPTVLHHVVEDTREELDEMIKLLTEHGADVNAVAYHGKTPLHLAWLRPGQPSTKVQILLEHGADLHARNGDGSSILHFYAESMQCELIKWACRRGLDVNVKHPQTGYTPLHYVHVGPCDMSTKNERIATTQLLLDLGADVNIADIEGATPLFFASVAADIESMRMLLDHGANVNHRGSTGLTALHWVANGFIVPMDSLNTEDFPYSDAITLLLERGAEINAQSLRGLTPLDWSVLNQVPEAQECLIEAGAFNTLRG